MIFSRQEYWSGLPFPPPGDHSVLGIELTSGSPALAGGSFTTEPPGKPTSLFTWRFYLFSTEPTWFTPLLGKSLDSFASSSSQANSALSLDEWPHLGGKGSGQVSLDNLPSLLLSDPESLTLCILKILLLGHETLLSDPFHGGAH